jgi:hypothetical protein
MVDMVIHASAVGACLKNGPLLPRLFICQARVYCRLEGEGRVFASASASQPDRFVTERKLSQNSSPAQ